MGTVYNVMEILVKEQFERVLENSAGCKCEKCRDDIMAFALNNLKPKYVASSKGELYTRANELATVYNVEIIKELAKAVKVISENPKH